MNQIKFLSLFKVDQSKILNIRNILTICSIKKKYKNKIIVIKRPHNLAGLNTETEKTFKHAMKSGKLKNAKYDFIFKTKVLDYYLGKR